MDFLTRDELETLPEGSVVWVQLYAYEDAEHWSDPRWQGEVTIADEPRWPGLRELRRADGSELAALDFRARGRGLFMGQDGTLEIDERRYARLFPDEHAGNRDYARRKGEHDRQLLSLAAAVAEQLPSPLPVEPADLRRPSLSLLERDGEIWVFAPLRGLALVLSADLHHPGQVLVRRQRIDGSPLDELAAPETWAGDSPLASLSPGELEALIDRVA